jgi:hypothetical protein
MPSEPFSIFSNRSARAQSATPCLMLSRARKRALDPVEQSLFTLTIGIPIRPSPYSARCPAVESPKT